MVSSVAGGVFLIAVAVALAFVILKQQRRTAGKKQVSNSHVMRNASATSDLASTSIPSSPSGAPVLTENSAYDILSGDLGQQDLVESATYATIEPEYPYVISSFENNNT